MNTAVVVTSPNAVSHAMTAVEMKAQVQRIQQVMKAVMKAGTHYGKIPGAGEKMTLFKPGAEVLCVTFRIAPKFRVEDLSDEDCIRYRVTCIGEHQTTGVVLAEGVGEASSNEEKYKWRAAVCDEEYDATPEDRRRIKWKRGASGNTYSIRQVRTEPADIANTVLKMAAKRAQVAMSINATGASDIFTQDLEDMPEELREHIGDDGNGGRDDPPRRRSQQTQPPRSRSASSNGNGSSGGSRATEKQIRLISVKLDQAGIPENEFFARFGINSIAELPFARVNEALAWIQNPESEREPGSDDEG